MFKTFLIFIFFSYLLSCSPSKNNEESSNIGSNNTKESLKLEGGRVSPEELKFKLEQGPRASPWPPKLNELFPDLKLIDHRGKQFSLSELKGKVILFEPIGMTCAACNSFSGADSFGAFKGQQSQPGLPSIDRLLFEYGKGASLNDTDLVFVQILLYDLAMRAPKPIHAKIWAEHFKLSGSANTYVTVSEFDMRSDVSFNMIPGFFLIDKDFILRSDSAGMSATHNLYEELLPMVHILLAETRK